ncbi:hypothetical protein AT6N2_C1619 [Agrobacterium tumefaciens]|nr:hypothetical protein AT6N2_C1619 [Agrobacterium tumefaciens]
MPGLTRHPAGARLPDERTSFSPRTWAGWIPDQGRHDGEVGAATKSSIANCGHLSLPLPEHLPPRRPEPQFGAHRHGGVERHFDFEVIGLMAVIGDVDFGDAGAGKAATGGDLAVKRVLLVRQHHVFRPEEQFALACAAFIYADALALEQHMAITDRDRQAGGFADEGEDKRRVGRIVDIVCRADLLDLALAHDNDAVRQFQRFFLIMGDKDGGVARAVMEFAQPAAQFLAHFGIERAERLVEKQHLRLDGDGAGKRHALALTAGKLGWIALFKAREMHHVEKFGHAFAYLGFRRAAGGRAYLQAESDVVGHRHMAEQRVMLEHETDIALLHRAV